MSDWQAIQLGLLIAPLMGYWATAESEQLGLFIVQAMSHWAAIAAGSIYSASDGLSPCPFGKQLQLGSDGLQP